MVDDSVVPSVLEARNIDAVAKYVKEFDVKKVVVMVSRYHHLRGRRADS